MKNWKVKNTKILKIDKQNSNGFKVEMSTGRNFSARPGPAREQL